MNLSSPIRSGRHCVFCMHVHLVFVTKYRKRVFTKTMLAFMGTVFNDVCTLFESNLIEFDGKQIMYTYSLNIHQRSLYPNW